MENRLNKEQTMQKMNVKGSCVKPRGLASGQTLWELFEGKQRKSCQFVDGRVMIGLLKSNLVEKNQQNEFVIN